MATPDYLQQVIVSGRRHGSGRANSARRGLFQRPSVTSLVWATLDASDGRDAAVWLSGCGYGRRITRFTSILPTLLRNAPPIWLLYLTWFCDCAGSDYTVFRTLRADP